MVQLLTLAGLLFANRCIAGYSDSVSQVYEPENQAVGASALHLIGSACGTVGTYSVGTRSRSASAYLTMSDEQRAYYTLGFATFWLEREDLDVEAFHKSLQHENAREYERAIQALVPALKEQKDDYLLNLRLGWLHYLAGNLAESKQYYTRAVAANSKSV